MIAYGTIKVNDSDYAKHLIVYAGQDETIGYNYIQDKANHLGVVEPSCRWAFDYKVISKGNSICATAVPDDINYIDLI